MYLYQCIIGPVRRPIKRPEITDWRGALFTANHMEIHKLYFALKRKRKKASSVSSFTHYGDLGSSNCCNGNLSTIYKKSSNSTEKIKDSRIPYSSVVKAWLGKMDLAWLSVFRQNFCILGRYSNHCVTGVLLSLLSLFYHFKEKGWLLHSFEERFW